jgi:hypothetical protein
MGPVATSGPAGPARTAQAHSCITETAPRSCPAYPGTGCHSSGRTSARQGSADPRRCNPHPRADRSCTASSCPDGHVSAGSSVVHPAGGVGPAATPRGAAAGVPRVRAAGQAHAGRTGRVPIALTIHLRQRGRPSGRPFFVTEMSLAAVPATGDYRGMQEPSWYRADYTHLWRPPEPPEPEVRESTLALLAVVVVVILLAGGASGP